jgi:hypothetical protein
MRLRVAKNIAFARNCGGACGHNWEQIQLAVTKVCRAHRRGSRLLSDALFECWSAEDRAKAGLPPLDSVGDSDT